MSKLRILNCRHTVILPPEKIESLKKKLPHLCINQGHLKIANSDHTFEPMDGFWEKKSSQLQLLILFSDINFSI